MSETETETETAPIVEPVTSSDDVDVFTVGTDIPDDGGILWITEVGPEDDGRVFIGTWVDQAYVDRKCEEDVFIRLTPVEGGRLVDVELVGAHQDQLMPGGAWTGLDTEWAQVLFGPTNTLMGLLIDVGAGECTHSATFARATA